MGKVGNTGENMSKVSMRLFGMPYQLPYTVDPRDSALNRAIGKHFLEKFLLEAPILTIVPGDPVFLPNYTSGSAKASAAAALLRMANSGSGKFNSIFDDGDGDSLRLYDFKKSYREYIRYVNLLCRVGAGYLDLNQSVNFGKGYRNLFDYDWKEYKWTNAGTNPQNFATWLSQSFKTSGTVRMDGSNDDNDAADGMSFEEVLSDYDFVQFYIDPESTSGDDMGNSSSESMLKGLFDGVGSKTKEIAWMMRNGQATHDFADMITESTENLSTYIGEALGGSASGQSALASALGRIINLSGNVVMGENIIIPNIYNSSTYNKSGFSATIHLKAPYGNVLSYYLDVFVPLMHLVALTIPRQSSPNTYSSPFIVKSFVEGSWTCNLGLVAGLNISKNNEARSINGLPSEVDVTIQFEDLYSTLSMNPSSEPNKFYKNPSLVEYLATNCGMSLTKPNTEKKIGMYVNTMKNAIFDAPNNFLGAISSWGFESTIGQLRSLLGM